MLILLIKPSISSPIHRYKFKEVDGIRITHFLGTVDKSSSMREDSSYISSHGTPFIGKFLHRSGNGGMVVIGSKAHLDFSCRQTIVFRLVCHEQILCTIALIEHIHE